uniref:peptidylprolyl isomerase n=3 Tax=Guillardia theta TaxID=55529 RepID=A0A7S4KHD2_GUITH|mmetsp:Transcript_24879/g.81904  ORF Transcript_24879/g.81904 Transcript_24879/m.81904 type:complete len:437 (+) Transcript_24879:479-1789(+)
MDLPNSQKKLAITVSADECNTAYETIISKLARTADVPGFRKGKAPPQMVLNHFGKKSITAQACEQIIGSAVPAALQQKNIRAIGQAQMADDEAIGKMIDNFAPGQDIKFEVLVDIWPEASLKGAYKGLTIEAEEEPFEEELVSNALSEMRKREAFSVLSGADTKAKVYPASLGDSVDEIKREGAVCVVDLIGYKKNADGSKGDRLPDLAIGENVEVVMEKGKFFEGFVESIDGMQAGDQASVPVTFPTNHKVAELRGMEAIFDVTIKGLKDMMYPALDDDFAKKIPNCDSVVALKKRIRESITEESLISTGKNVDKALENAIVDLVDVEIPETLVDEQTKTKFASMMSDFKAKGMDDEQIKSMITKENYDRYKSTSRDNTVRSLRISFVIGEIAKQEGIKVDPTEIESQVLLPLLLVLVLALLHFPSLRILVIDRG